MNRLAYMFLVVSAACGTSPAPATNSDDDVGVAATQAYLSSSGEALTAAADTLLASTPSTPFSSDDASLTAMRNAWLETRARYCNVEAAIDMLAPSTLADTYEQDIHDARDENPFDNVGFSGLHGIERILWANLTLDATKAYEEQLFGYSNARFPEIEQEADDLRNKMIAEANARIVEATALIAQSVVNLTFAGTFTHRSITAQFTKVDTPQKGADASRYSRSTLADMRSNLAGARAIYTTFASRLPSDTAAAIEARFAAIDTQYASIAGDALPDRPEDFDSSHPSNDAYGQLYALLAHEVDSSDPSSLVSLIDAAVSALIATLSK
jgi:iron uptake system component EfeO